MKEIQMPACLPDSDLPSGPFWEQSPTSETSQDLSSCPICAIQCAAKSVTASDLGNLVTAGQESSQRVHCSGVAGIPLDLELAVKFVLKKFQSGQQEPGKDCSCSEGKKDIDAEGFPVEYHLKATAKSTDNRSDSMSPQGGSGQQQQSLSTKDTTSSTSTEEGKVAIISLDELFHSSQNQSWADMAEEDCPELFISCAQSSTDLSLHQPDAEFSDRDAWDGFEDTEMPRTDYSFKEPISLISLLRKRRPDLWI
ncbi:hypothetical protein QBC42DRAFT_251554 [Cladorrhinum samala]|uniref:Uncharacterized protein n=1 Tax=Cladorrhinum samala TaxID=585594 RepID=A0AAV9HNI6_9PEZI|nr:hypothetical protein QBC42DRAFT_251554 [Cladorrhinum samala]